MEKPLKYIKTKEKCEEEHYFNCYTFIGNGYKKS